MGPKGIQEVKRTGASDGWTGHGGRGACPAGWVVLSFMQKKDAIVGGGAGRRDLP